MPELTPMMQQYMEIKAQNPDCILFFRLGDFYEMFAEDAKLVSKELDLTLTTRDRGKAEADRIPMCGVPYHSSESYIARLVGRGYKVAICEQMEDPALAKGLVRREITRVITPGTVLEASMLDEGRNNYFACIFGEGGNWGFCFCDISTGAFLASSAQSLERVLSEVGRFAPAEALLGGEARSERALGELLQNRLGACVDSGEAPLFDLEAAARQIAAQFGAPPEELGLSGAPATQRAAGALLATLRQTQKTDLSHIRKLEYYISGRFMELDLTARRNLELTETLRGKEKRGSLLWVLDKTHTAMGSRLLRSWLEKPLLSPAPITQRLTAVDELTRQTVTREELLRMLREVSDLERAIARIVTGTAGCRDLAGLAAGCACLPQLRAALATLSAPLMQDIVARLDDLSDLKARIDRAVVDDPPFSVREGGMIRPGYSEQLDALRDIQDGGKDTLAAIEAQEKQRTGIAKLHVGYNRVFGYYIEVSKSYLDQVPEDWMRKQTLTNCERFITPELKQLEQTILTARDRITALEYELFCELRQYVAGEAPRVQATAQAVAEADVLCTLAAVAVKNHYCRPEIDLSGSIDIRDGRHPVVEQMLQDSRFVPNDTQLGGGEGHIAIITGPNMAGKSTYMRQVALITLMAQVGSFVPAASARIGIVDRIFTRIGASDDLAAGQSTFMVEMTEVAGILREATPRSLLILDEIGRGTSTFDGMAIARAVLEYVADRKKLGAKTLFATHYHELCDLADDSRGIRNYNIAVKKRQGDMIFLRKIVPGAADDSYGVEVAGLAGLPNPVIRRARELLQQLEQGAPETAPQPVPAPDETQVSMLDLGTVEVRRRLEAVSVETLTPIEAMNLLYQLKQLL